VWCHGSSQIDIRFKKLFYSVDTSVEWKSYSVDWVLRIDCQQRSMMLAVCCCYKHSQKNRDPIGAILGVVDPWSGFMTYLQDQSACGHRDGLSKISFPVRPCAKLWIISMYISSFSYESSFIMFISTLASQRPYMNIRLLKNYQSEYISFMLRCSCETPVPSSSPCRRNVW
jgi:hypothetical protein